jgi:Uma2 family endonuclease
MNIKPSAKATIADLYTLSDHIKAEIVHDAIVLMPPTGDAPGYTGDEIFVALRHYSQQTQPGRAVGGNKGFRVNLPDR